MQAGHRQSAHGFTLLELLVASMLMVLVALMSGQLWRYFTVQAADLRNRSIAAQELKSSLEGLKEDMGAVAWAAPLGSERLAICHATGDAQDQVVVTYALDEGRLVRSESASLVPIAVANHVAGFHVEDLTSTLMQVVVTVTCGNVTRQATLLWSRP